MVGAALIYAKRGLMSATAAFFITFISCLATFNYYELVEYLLVRLYKPLAPYADALGLLLSFIVVFLALQYCAMTVLEESVNINGIVNGLAGALFGGMSGMILAGLLAISWLMMPGSSYYLPEEPAVFFGADEVVLTTVRFISNERLTGQQPFDPTHTFMRRNTYKFAKGPATDFNVRSGPKRPAGGRTGLESDGTSTRREIERELGNE